MNFSEEEIKEINKKIKSAEDRQLKNGNKTYTIKEAWNIVNNKLGEIQYL